MSNANRVVWSEGMFLRVQHFQQSDRWAENLVASTAQLLSPFAWGVSRLVINPGLLEDARLGLVEARGLLPDGTPFSAPDEVELPPPLELEEGTKERTVYLTLPTRQPGAPEIASGPAPGGNANALRYAGEARELADTNQGSPVVMPVAVGRLRLRLRLEGEDLAGFERIPIARVAEVRSDRSVVLDESFVPTCLNCSASLPLETMASEILGTVGHRAEAIADRMGDPSVRGTAEVTDFQFLQVLNRYEVALRHIGETLSVVHPERLYATLATLAGEMATFTRERRRPPAFPGYRHADLTASFAPVMAELRASLSAVLERSAIEIRLEERRHGVRVGRVEDRGLLANAGFVLAVRSDMPQEQLRSAFPRQSKIGPVERIAELVNVALPGIPVVPLPVAPRQLPYRPGTTYFGLDRDTPLWKQLSASGGIDRLAKAMKRGPPPSDAFSAAACPAIIASKSRTASVSIALMLSA